MAHYPFIFSNEIRHRLRRHVLFWLCWWVFQAFLYSFVGLASKPSYWQQLQVSALEAVVYLMPHMFLSYSLMYGVVPKTILKGRYIAAFFSVVMLFLITALISAGIGVYLLYPIRRLVLPFVQNVPIHSNYTNIYLALLAGLRGAITVGGMAAAIKLMKYWYVKEQQNLELQKQNIAAQLNVLKAQVHPHFLFNTLNNIYAHTQTAAPSAAKLVLGLSDLLRHILYECNQESVPLQKELKLLHDYILLEKVRYDDRLDITVDIPDQTDGYFIAPLLLLPFIENCFKHGTSAMIEQPWIHLAITVHENKLNMKLVNGKSPASGTNAGIGIVNVKQRLDLLYPGRYTLQLFNEETMFIVNLKLELERAPVREVVTIPAKAITYANS